MNPPASGIVTITFNPCIDKSTTVPAIVPETKLHCTAPVFEPGGGGINVARVLKKLGGDALAIYPAGGYPGRFLNVLLEKEGLTTAVIETATHTRENMIVLDTAANKQYRFGMPGAPIAEAEWQQCLLLLKQLDAVQFIVASGSLPPGVPTDIFARIARIAKAKGAKLIVDTSGPALKQALEEGVYLAKPNLKEFGYLIGKQDATINDVYESAGNVLAAGNSHAMVVSLGASGAMLITAQMVLHIETPPVEVKSTVGAGDSMVAGMVLSLSKQASLCRAVHYGIACGTATTLAPGTALCKAEDVDAIISKIDIVSKMPC